MAQALALLWTSTLLLILAGSGWAFLRSAVRGHLIQAGGIMSVLLLSGIGLDLLDGTDVPAFTWLAMRILPFSCGMILTGVIASMLKGCGFGGRKQFPARISGHP
jgi:hypothetical protein